MKLTEQDRMSIIDMYSVHLTPMIALAELHGVTRGTIYNVLLAAGVDTSKRRIPVSCTVCGTEVLRTKGRIRKTKRVFCSHACYFAWLENRESRYWRHGQRLARKAVAEVFNLQPGHIVHHVDGNQAHNAHNNLAVFANQGDHIRYHRGFEAHPIWDGATRHPQPR